MGTARTDVSADLGTFSREVTPALTFGGEKEDRRAFPALDFLKDEGWC